MDTLLGISALAIASGKSLAQMWAPVPSTASAPNLPIVITLPIAPPFILATGYTSVTTASAAIVMIANGVQTTLYTQPVRGTNITLSGKTITLGDEINAARQLSAIYPI